MMIERTQEAKVEAILSLAVLGMDPRRELSTGEYRRIFTEIGGLAYLWKESKAGTIERLLASLREVCEELHGAMGDDYWATNTSAVYGRGLGLLREHGVQIEWDK